MWTDVDIYRWPNFGVSLPMEEFNMLPRESVWMRILTTMMMAEMTMRWRCTLATESSGKSGNLWMERSSTGTLADVWIFRTVRTVVVVAQMFGLTTATKIFPTRNGFSPQNISFS